jgi:hypothetical protein
LQGWISFQTADYEGEGVNIPCSFALASDPAESRADLDLLGVAVLPVAEEDLQSYTRDGGWNLFMNANTRHGSGTSSSAS